MEGSDNQMERIVKMGVDYFNNPLVKAHTLLKEFCETLPPDHTLRHNNHLKEVADKTNLIHQLMFDDLSDATLHILKTKQDGDLYGEPYYYELDDHRKLFRDFMKKVPMAQTRKCCSTLVSN